MRDMKIDFQAIDIRAMSPERREAVIRQATRRAHLERSRAFRHLAGSIRAGAVSWLRRLRRAEGQAGRRDRRRHGLERLL